jgi:hypothetical protein
MNTFLEKIICQFRNGMENPSYTKSIVSEI